VYAETTDLINYVEIIILFVKIIYEYQTVLGLIY